MSQIEHAEDAWANNVSKIEDILRSALAMMQSEGLSGNENRLNRELYFRIVRANNAIYKLQPERAFDHPPAAEAQNTPTRTDGERDSRTKKIPDFQWNFVDHNADNPEEGIRTYVIECKKLGSPERADWNYNENYAHHGVRRFVDPSHLYGKEDPDGAMIGYVHSMEFTDIHKEVDNAIVHNSIVSLPGPPAGWAVGGVSELEHPVSRVKGVSPYRLKHFWIDLRKTT
jgi:hypothetical protein